MVEFLAPRVQLALLGHLVGRTGILDLVAHVEVHPLVRTVVLRVRWAPPDHADTESDPPGRDSRVIPQRARVQAKGGPLSTWIARGRP